MLVKLIYFVWVWLKIKIANRFGDVVFVFLVLLELLSGVCLVYG